MAATDHELITRAQAGDTMAFGILAQRYQTAVFNVAYRLMGRRRDAEDATQEAFLRAYRALARFDSKRPFAPWIKRITTNYCLNQLGSMQTKTQVVVTDTKHEADDHTPDMDNWANESPTPEQSMEKQQQDALLRSAILALSPNYRAAIELRHFQELSYEEMAAVLKRPLSSVKSDLFRARKQLAIMLKGEKLSAIS
ncbi:MAG: RNA polymerase subunit sigma-24 [Chloroflexi bacterium]|nr:MAG: RNA polymerase subunit sigma-24 [Chloroflexota bacterium]